MTMQADHITRTLPPTGAIGRAVHANRLLLGLVLVHLLAAVAISRATGMAFTSGTTGVLLTALKVLIPMFLILLALARLIWIRTVVRPARLIPYLAADLRSILCDADRLAFGVVAFGAIAVMCGTFTYIKDMIPILNPFAWDITFAAWDRALHGGVDPWRLVAPLANNSAITTGLNLAYNLWFFFLYFTVFHASFDTRNRARSMTYLLTFTLAWIVWGNILAVIFSSVGPAFYAEFGYGDVFAPQLAMLRDLAEIRPVWALDTQVMLLDNYHTGGPVRGISAMPSMHVTMAVAMALYAFSIRRWLGWVMTGYAALIMVGSVHLAWHYAIDGYLGAVGAITLWYLSRMVVRRLG